MFLVASRLSGLTAGLVLIPLIAALVSLITWITALLFIFFRVLRH
jgi:hypothetical protein